jgi:hypothetical protein
MDSTSGGVVAWLSAALTPLAHSAIKATALALNREFLMLILCSSVEWFPGVVNIQNRQPRLNPGSGAVIRIH